MYYHSLELQRIVNSKKSYLYIKSQDKFPKLVLTFLFFCLFIKYNLKQKHMIINFIFSVLLLIVGFAFCMVVLLFGVKFCRNGERLPDDATWKDIVLQLIKGYPFWVWIIVFLVFQPAIVHIINTWFPSVWNSCDWITWIPEFTDFIAFISLAFFALLFRITDEYGKLKIFRKS